MSGPYKRAGAGWVDASGEAFVAGGTKFSLPPLPAPPGTTVVGLSVVDEAGQPREVYQTIPKPLAQVRVEQIAAAKIAYDAQRQAPLIWNFGSIVALDDTNASQGAAGAQTLQMRDSGGIDDVKNWLAAQMGAMTAMLAGAPSAVQPIKVTSNLWIQTTAADVAKVLVASDGVQLSMLGRAALQLKAFGSIKDAIVGATTVQAVLAVDLNAGYPPTT